MIPNKNEIQFNQLVLNVELGKYNTFQKNERILYLSKGLLIAINKELIFYDYNKFSRTLIMTFTNKENLFMKISKLLDDKFCIYTPTETKIYQFNNDNFSITLLKKINLNLVSLIEIEKNVFINITEKNIYIWKELKPIIKADNYIILSFIILLVCIIIKILTLPNFTAAMVIIIAIYLFIVLENIINKYIYVIYPYKKLKFPFVYNIEKCGNNLCCIKSTNFIRVYNYKTYETIYELVSFEENPENWSFLMLKENYIIIIDESSKRLKIYDCGQNKIIKDERNKFIENLENTFEIGDNIFITIQGQIFIKWKYNFQNNDITILSQAKRKYLYSDIFSSYVFVQKKIVNKRLYILKMKFTSPEKNYKKFNLYVYQ